MSDQFDPYNDQSYIIGLCILSALLVPVFILFVFVLKRIGAMP